MNTLTSIIQRSWKTWKLSNAWTCSYYEISFNTN